MLDGAGETSATQSAGSDDKHSGSGRGSDAGGAIANASGVTGSKGRGLEFSIMGVEVVGMGGVGADENEAG